MNKLEVEWVDGNKRRKETEIEMEVRMKFAFERGWSR